MLLFTTGGHTANAVLYTKLPYDSQKSFTPITQVTTFPGFVMLVRTNSPYRTFSDLTVAARANPGTLSFASYGTGNTTHLVGELFARAANLQLVHVPYKGSPTSDLLGGHETCFLYRNIEWHADDSGTQGLRTGSHACCPG